MITDEETARNYVREHWGEAPLETLDQLASLLIDENNSQNLISSATVPNIFQRHIADSAQLVRLVPRGTSGAWLDLGSGAGFPGLVAAVLAPESQTILIESRSRRVEWLQRATAELGLENVEVIGRQLEVVPALKAAIISARAFAPFMRTLDLAGRFSTNETLWLLPKGRSAQQELESAGRLRSMFHVEQSLTDPDAGIIVGHLPAEKVGKA